jgi:hypothetical protein
MYANAIFMFTGVRLLHGFSLRLHQAPTPEPVEEPLPGEHPVPQKDPVPSPNPEVDDPRPGSR